MKRVGETMYRAPGAQEAETLAHVAELARSWQDGALPLDAVARQCTGYERWQATRFAPPGSDDKRAVMALVDALVRAESGPLAMHHGAHLIWIDRSELESGLVRSVGAGDRFRWVWPMFEMDGERVYPKTDAETFMTRFDRENAAMAAYREYRKRKKPKGWGER